MNEGRHQIEDHQLSRTARQALQAEPMLHGLSIFVTIDDGAAGLYGQVPTRSEALIAERAVLAVPGVHAVAENLVVPDGSRLSDRDIAHSAAGALMRAPHIPDTVWATVAHGHVTLTGEVNWQYEREAACLAVNELPGAAAVHDAVAVRAGTLAIELQESIVTALVDRDPLAQVRLTVTTNGRGAIMLDGSVPTVQAQREAEAICWQVPGAVSVTSHLVVAAIDDHATA